MIKEHDVVVLTAPFLADGVEFGEIGTVVHLFKDGPACMVEVFTREGDTKAVVTAELSQVRLATSDEIADARETAAG